MEQRARARSLGQASSRRKRAIQQVWVTLLAGAAVVSVARGLRNAWNHSQDFQWNPEVQFVHGIDPCKYYLQNHTQFLSQIPPYGHFLYILFLPFGFMSFATAKLIWSVLNVGFAVSVFYLLKSKFPDRRMAFFFLVALLCSTPFRETMYNGQHALLSLSLVAFSVWASDHGRPRWAGFLGGVAAFKYSFGIPLFPAYLNKPWTAVAAYSLASLIGIVVYALWLHDGLWETVLLPLRVTLSPNAHGPGATDLMTFLERHNAGGMSYALPMAVLLGLVVVDKAWLRIQGLLDRCAYYTVAAFLVALHIPYDQVFLLLPAIAAIRARRDLKYAIWAITAYFWYAAFYVGELWARLSTAPDHNWPPFGRVHMLPYNHAMMWGLLAFLIVHFAEKRRETTPQATSTFAALSGRSSPNAR